MNNIGQFRLAFYKQIHEIVFYGNGGYTWDTVYSMPIWLRKHTFHLLKEHYENKAKDANTQDMAIDTDGTVKNTTPFTNQSNQSTKITPGPKLNGPIKYK